MTPYDHLATLGYDEANFLPSSLSAPRPKTNFWNTPFLGPVTPKHVLIAKGVVIGLYLLDLLYEDMKWQIQRHRILNQKLVRRHTPIKDTHKIWHRKVS